MDLISDAINGDHYRLEFEGSVIIWPAWCEAGAMEGMLNEWTAHAAAYRAQGGKFHVSLMMMMGGAGKVAGVLRNTPYAALAVDGAIVDVPNIALSPRLMGVDPVPGYEGMVYANDRCIMVCGRAQDDIMITSAANLAADVEAAMRKVVEKEEEARQRRSKVDVRPVARLILSRLDPSARADAQAWISASHEEMRNLRKDKATCTLDVGRMEVGGLRSARIVMTDRCKVNGTMDLGAAQLHEDGINAKVVLSETIVAGLAGMAARSVVDHEILDGRVIDSVTSQRTGLTTIRLRRPDRRYMPIAA